MNQNFYATPDRQVQNEYILKFVTVETPQRSRKRRNMLDRQVSVKYYFNKHHDGVVKRNQVCKKTFIETLGISRDRVQILCRKFFESGSTPVDKRGGDTRSAHYKNRREAVRSFIQAIRSVEKHYCRAKNVHRHYLPSDLSIKKLCDMYNEKSVEDLKVNYEFFRNIFDNDFNIGFGTPATDVCSFCLMHKENLKLTHDEDEKRKLNAELTVHKAKAKAFYDNLRTDIESVKVISFDCQKNLILPKLPDQSSYYLRQLYYYNFTVCEGLSTDKQTKENTFCYVWLENEFSKGSCQIASAIYHRLSNTSLENINTVKLVSDGCGGQNKNSTMVGMACTWLAKDAPPSVKNVILLFPVVGHSYIPPDRIFGRIEKEVRTKSTILNPEEYEEIFNKVATVFKVGTDTEVLDWKTAVLGVPKTSQQPAVPGTAKSLAQWHFKFQPSKKITLTKSSSGTIKVQGDVGYTLNIGVPKSICRKGKTWKDTTPNLIPKGTVIKAAKLKDIKSLLKAHYGPNWDAYPNLQFYKRLCVDQEALLQGDLPQEHQEDDIGEIPVDGDILGV